MQAVEFSVRRHGNAVRKDGAMPHWVHALRVAELLRCEADVTDWDVLVAAVLHDVMEESPTKFEELEGPFGTRAAQIVAELTDDKRQPKRVRKAAMLAKASELSHEAKLVKLADRVENAEDSWLRTSSSDTAATLRETYLAETRQLLESLAGTHAALEERLLRAVDQQEE